MEMLDTAIAQFRQYFLTGQIIIDSNCTQSYRDIHSLPLSNCLGGNKYEVNTKIKVTRPYC